MNAETAVAQSAERQAQSAERRVPRAGEQKFLKGAWALVGRIATDRGLGAMAKEIYKEDTVAAVTHGRTIHFRELDMGERAMVLARLRTDAGLPAWPGAAGSGQRAGGSRTSKQPAAGSGQKSGHPAICQLPVASSNVIRLATLESLQLLRTLVEQLRWSTDECNGYFQRACGAAHPRTQRQVQKAIECCKAVVARRQKAAGSRQRAAGSELGGALS